MAEIKLTQLPSASTSTPLDYFMIVQNGVNKKISLTTLLKTLDSGDNIQINPSRNAVNFQISSIDAPYLFYTSGAIDSIGINTQNPQSLFHVMGNIQVGTSSNDGVVIHASEDILYSAATDLPQGIGWFKPLDAARDTSTLRVDTGVTVGQFNLANGLSGQYKALTLVSSPVGSKATVKVLSGIGFNRIDFTGVGNSVLLKCVTVGGIPKWVCTGYYLANLYTV